MDYISIQKRCQLVIDSGKGEGHRKLCEDFNNETQTLQYIHMMLQIS